MFYLPITINMAKRRTCTLWRCNVLLAASLVVVMDVWFGNNRMAATVG